MKSLADWAAERNVDVRSLRAMRDAGLITADKSGGRGRGNADLYSREAITKALVLTWFQAHGYSGHFLKLIAGFLENDPDRFQPRETYVALSIGWKHTAELIAQGEHIVFRVRLMLDGTFFGGSLRADEKEDDPLASLVAIETRMDLTKLYGAFLRAE